MCRGTQDTRFELLLTRCCVLESDTVLCPPVWSCVIRSTTYGFDTRRSVIVEWWIANPNRFQTTTMSAAKLIEKKGRLPPSATQSSNVMAPSHHRRPAAKTPSMSWYPARAADVVFGQTRRCNASEEHLPTEHLDFSHCL
ncbi:hypothetical protein QR685DRAFT_571906 [Neurospora intermedia]|uniref:Questionable protein n=1 Tax=Neurospora intermedia TaxID=5142 RepID=A0ABR3DF19_NEUIN